MLSHHVFASMKSAKAQEISDKLIEVIKPLENIETVKSLQIGVPASTEKRDVVDNSFSVSELMLVDDVEGQNAYQVHPIHKKFVEDCSHLWEKVIVYDAIDI